LLPAFVPVPDVAVGATIFPEPAGEVYILLAVVANQVEAALTPPLERKGAVGALLKAEGLYHEGVEADAVAEGSLDGDEKVATGKGAEVDAGIGGEYAEIERVNVIADDEFGSLKKGYQGAHLRFFEMIEAAFPDVVGNADGDAQFLQPRPSANGGDVPLRFQIKHDYVFAHSTIPGYLAL
jgi:hypothetical protein